MSAVSYSVFKTSLGVCAVAWTAHGICAVQLPERTEAETERRVVLRFPDAAKRAADGAIADAIRLMTELLSGVQVSLEGIPLDMSRVPPFHQQVYAASRSIGAGQTTTYGALADRVGSKGAARAVGQAMGRNPFPIVVPCHRVLAAGDKLGGFSAAGGIVTKERMLEIERAPIQTSLFASNGTLGFDLEMAVSHLRESDVAMARLIDKVGPCRLAPKKTDDLFSALMEAIVYQQLTGKAAETIHGRVCALLPKKRPYAAAIAALAENELRAPGSRGQRSWRYKIWHAGSWRKSFRHLSNWHR